MIVYRNRVVPAAVSLILLFGCAPAPDIQEVVENPREFADRTVTLRGEVQDTFGLLTLKYYTLKDDTGSISVVTERPLPRKGEKLRVTGRVTEAFTLGSRSMVVLVEDKPKK